MNQIDKKGISEIEFIALMALLMSNVALCIDTILPALTDIGTALEVSNTNRLQMVIFLVFFGLGAGELLFGTLSDSFGRKPIVYVGVGIFTAASLLIIFSPNLEILLFGRVLQGIGLSAARSVSIAIIRDTHGGDRMARIMSFIATVFILVPMVAPLLGQIILKSFSWQAIFYFQLIFIGLTLIWFWLRQKETLSASKRIPFSRQLFTNGLKEFFKHKKAVLYTVITGLIQGTFIAYLGSAQQIFQVQYGMVEEFPYIFGGLAFAIGISSLTNGFLVVKLGMLKLVQNSLYIFISTALIYLLLYASGQNPTITVLIGFLVLQFLSVGFIHGNLSSLAMEPIGHIAGIGAAIFSFIAMTIGVLVAILIGLFIQDTVHPIFFGFCISGLLGFILIRINRSKL